MTKTTDYKPEICPQCGGKEFRLSRRYGWVCCECNFCTNPDDPFFLDEGTVTCELCDEEYSKSEVEINEDGTWGCRNCGNFNHQN